MLYVIGLGLNGVGYLSPDVFAFLISCQKIYLETYTSVVFNAEGEFTDIVADLKDLLKTDAEYVTADREMVECGTEIVTSAKSGETAFLVVGDPLSSATHTDLIMRALDEGVDYKIMNNTSIMAVMSCGLRMKRFSQTVSIPFWDDCGRQSSILDKIEANMRRGRHTLCLMDIKVKERSIENILRDRKIYEPPRFMSCSTAAMQLMECLDEDCGDQPLRCLTKNTLCVGMSRVGGPTERIFAGTLGQVADSSDDCLGGPLHCLVIAGHCDETELAFLSDCANLDLDYLHSLYESHKTTL